MKNLAALGILVTGLVGMYFKVDYSSWIVLLGAIITFDCDWSK